MSQAPWTSVGAPLGTSRSGEAFSRAKSHLVEGVNSPSRGAAHIRPYPLFMARGEGAELIDVDGNRYVDLMLGFGCLLHGHAHPRIVERLQSAAERGFLVASNTETESAVAELISSMVPCAERIRMANTGTEAAMAALRVARGHTGCQKFVKFEGHYHGWGDAFSVSSNPLPSGTVGHKSSPIPVIDSSGVPAGAVEDTIVVPWNDLDRLEAVLQRHRGQLAAVVMEGAMANAGVIQPDPGYLEGVRALTEQHGVILWIDETVTGFRVAAGGVQERFGITADIATYGKALGAGLPGAALVGKAEILDSLEAGRVLHYGTHNANPIVLNVIHESLAMLSEGGSATYARLDSQSDRLVRGITDSMQKNDCPVVVQSVGAMLQVMFLRPGHEHVTAISSGRDFADHVDPDRFRLFSRLLLDHGVFMPALPSLHSVLATVTTDDQITTVLTAVDQVAAMMGDGS